MISNLKYDLQIIKFQGCESTPSKELDNTYFLKLLAFKGPAIKQYPIKLKSIITGVVKKKGKKTNMEKRTIASLIDVGGGAQVQLDELLAVKKPTLLLQERKMDRVDLARISKKVGIQALSQQQILAKKLVFKLFLNNRFLGLVGWHCHLVEQFMF